MTQSLVEKLKLKMHKKAYFYYVCQNCKKKLLRFGLEAELYK